MIGHTPYPQGVASVASGTCVNEKIPSLWEVDPKAFKYAVASGHESVLEHCTFTFAIGGISRACSHQLVRHRMASYSQQSQRYVKMDEFEYVTPESFMTTVTDDYWNTESSDNSTLASEEFESLMEVIGELYERMIRAGIPEEDARYVLPNACTTNIVVTMNARELRHFFNLRCCNRAQWEIRELADRMLELCKETCPILFEDAGASCVATGRCPEGKKSCGKVKE